MANVLLGILNLLFIGRSHFDEVLRYRDRDDVVFAWYGHTTLMDGVYGVVQCMRHRPFKLIVKKKHKNKIPARAHAYVHFVDTTKQRNFDTLPDDLDCPLLFAIEGSRKRKDHIHSGFYHYAKAKKCKIVFLTYDIGKFRMFASDEYDPAVLSKTEILEKLRTFVEKRRPLVVHPSKCSRIAWREE